MTSLERGSLPWMPKFHPEQHPDRIPTFAATPLEEIPPFPHAINVVYGETITDARQRVWQRAGELAGELNLAEGSEVLQQAAMGTLPIAKDDALYRSFTDIHVWSQTLALGNWRLIWRKIHLINLNALTLQDKEDLFQTTFVRLIEAAKRYNPWAVVNGDPPPDEGRTFSSYAWKYIQQGFRIELAHQANWGFQEHDMDLFDTYRRMERAMTREMDGQRPSHELIVAAVCVKLQKASKGAQDANPTWEEAHTYLDRQKEKQKEQDPTRQTSFQKRVEQFRSIVHIVMRPTSLDDPSTVLYEHQESGEVRSQTISLGERFLPALYDEKNMPREDETDLRERLANALQGLDPEERKIITMHFGLTDGEPQSFQQIADHFGNSIEKIKRIEAKALRKLRHPTKSRPLREYL